MQCILQSTYIHFNKYCKPYNILINRYFNLSLFLNPQRLRRVKLDLSTVEQLSTV